MSTSPRRESGLTIVELIIFIVIVSVAAAAVLSTFAMTTRTGADPVRRKQALLIAEGFLEEVQQAAFTFCDPTDTKDNPAAPSQCTASLKEQVGPEVAAGNARPFDNVNDYVGALDAPYTAFTSNGVLVDAAGVPLGVTGYTATLTLRAEALNGITSTADVETQDVLRATVRVAYGPGATDFIELDAYRTRYAPQVAQ
jgi:MSHA pilin protein MshD